MRSSQAVLICVALLLARGVVAVSGETAVVGKFAVSAIGGTAFAAIWASGGVFQYHYRNAQGEFMAAAPIGGAPVVAADTWYRWRIVKAGSQVAVSVDNGSTTGMVSFSIGEGVALSTTRFNLRQGGGGQQNSYEDDFLLSAVSDPQTSSPPATICGRLLYDGEQQGEARVDAVPLWGPTRYEASAPGPGVYVVSNVSAGAEMLVTTQANDFPLVPAQGFFVFNNQDFPQNVTLAGGVLASDFADVTIYPGLNLVGYPYCADIAWEKTTLAQTCPNGSRMYLWDAASNQFLAHSKTDDAWSPTGTVLSVGAGFQFLNVSGAVTNWREACPYSDNIRGVRLSPPVNGSAVAAATTHGYTVYASRDLHEEFEPVAEFVARPSLKALASFVATNPIFAGTGIDYLTIAPRTGEQDYEQNGGGGSGIVGFVRRTVPPGSRALFSPCFEPLGDMNSTVGDVLGWSLTGGATPDTADQIAMYDGLTQTATFLWKDAQTNWWTWKKQSGLYGIFAYLDSNGDGSCNSCEASGLYSAVPLHVAHDVSGIDIRLTDPDSDGDGMPDWWEKQNGLGISTNDAAADADSDGFPNLAEYIAGTSPTNSANRLRVVACGLPPSPANACTLAWETVAGRFYNVLTTTNLLLPWTRVSDAAGRDILGDGLRAVYTNAPVEAERFFRIKVDRVPGPR